MIKKQYNKRITIDPDVLVGKPVIKGTRIAVELILRLLAQGQTPADIVKNYPHLKKADIYAAIEYAREIIEQEKVYSLQRPSHEKAKTFAR